MNLRTLKKLSKVAAPILPLLGDHREQFRSVLGEDNYIGGTFISARKHWERRRTAHGGGGRGREILVPARDGRGWVRHCAPDHPRKGTVMVGATSGYYEPEWDEETAWTALERLVRSHFTDWSEDGPVVLRKFRFPRDVLAAARELIARQEHT